MRKFDPWPIFFRREWNRNWPFLVGFAITGTIITKFSLGLTGNPSYLLSHIRAKYMRLYAQITEICEINPDLFLFDLNFHF